MARAILIACSVWWLVTFVVQWLSAWTGRKPSRPLEPVRHQAADFSVVAPMVGAEDASPAYIDALNLLAREGVEVLICVEREEDEAVAVVRRLWPDAPILFGLETRFTAKVNNVEKGFRAASRPVVALCDAGALLTIEQLKRTAAPLSDTTGMVLALKAAEQPENFAAEIERADIDGPGARFLFAADWLGISVASGGVTVLARETLERIGHGEGFTRHIADDFSVSESVRAL
ncbi:MAG: glycosyltransferase [Acidimicrobiia bacterium]